MNPEKHLTVEQQSTPQIYTSLPDGSYVRKDDLRIEACGTIDELNSHIGSLVAEVSLDLVEELQHIQRQLFAIGAHLVGVSSPVGFPALDEVEKLQVRIDDFRRVSGKFNSFVLPGGCHSACISHICRTICRRAERCAVRLDSYPDVVYLNKLSSYFFFLSLYLNKIKGVGEIKV